MQQNYRQKKEQRSVQILDNSEKGLGLEEMSFEVHSFRLTGRLFHNFGANDVKAWSPTDLYVLGVWRGVREEDLV